MSYATQQDLVDRFGELEIIQLSDRADPPAGAIDAAVVAKALADADELINGYVGARYDLPLGQTPQLLVRLAADIARFNLYSQSSPSDEVRKRYEEAVQTLMRVSKGDVALDVGGSPPPAQPDRAEVQAPERIFSRDTLKGF